jgi:hypothetical protein
MLANFFVFMDKYIEGVKLFFKQGKSLSPMDFTYFQNLWFSDDTKFTGYNQSNFNLYIQLSNENKQEGSNIFAFSQLTGIETYLFSRTKRDVSRIDLVDNREISLDYANFTDIHRSVSSRGFNLSKKDESFLAEKITLAFREMGLYDKILVPEYASANKAPTNTQKDCETQILDLGEGVIIHL